MLPRYLSGMCWYGSQDSWHGTSWGIAETTIEPLGSSCARLGDCSDIRGLLRVGEQIHSSFRKMIKAC